MLSCDSPVSYYSNVSASLTKATMERTVIDEIETHEIVKKVLYLLPEAQEISLQDFEVSQWILLKV